MNNGGSFHSYVNVYQRITIITSWCMILTLWQFNIAIENGTFIVYLPIKDGDFP